MSHGDARSGQSASPGEGFRLPFGILLIQLVATCFMTGVIWLVQLVHYPLMAGWPHDQFGRWEEMHRVAIGPVVMPMMIVEGLAVIALVLRRPAGLPRWMAWTGLVLLGGIWTSTIALQIPCHDILSQGWDEAAFHRLVGTNWIRTVLWTMRSALATAAVWTVVRSGFPAR